MKDKLAARSSWLVTVREWWLTIVDFESLQSQSQFTNVILSGPVPIEASGVEGWKEISEW